MQKIIALVLQNSTIVLLLLGLINSGLVLWRSPERRTKAGIVDTLLTYFLLYSVAIGYLYNGIIHIFFGKMVAEFIGWANSPFQREVGSASIGFSVLGLLAV